MEFSDIRHVDREMPTFFPRASYDQVPYLLKKHGFTDFEVIDMKAAAERFGPGLEIPEVRLTPDAPRVEKHLLCLVSRLHPEDLGRWIAEMHGSQEAIAFQLGKNARIQAEMEEAGTAGYGK